MIVVQLISVIFSVFLISHNIYQTANRSQFAPTDSKSAVSVTYNKFPAPLQLYPRDSQDSAAVTFSGTVLTPGYDTLVVTIYRNNILWKKNLFKLNYSGGTAPFSVSPKIHAELAEYKFILSVKNSSANDSIGFRDSIVCGDVYLINGQSNSHPVSSSATYRNEYCRSFGKNTNYDPYNPADTLWGLARGNDAVNFHTGVWGIKLQQYIRDNYNIPVCILNGGSGGSTIGENLRDDFNHTNLNTTYGRLLYRAIKAGVQNNIKAIIWYQGESDCTIIWQNYLLYFTMLRNAWMEDYPGISKIYLFQIRMGCGGPYQSQLREVHRRIGGLFSNVELMSTMGVWGHDGCHYNYLGYYESALNIFRLIARDFYHSADTININPPNIISAVYTSPERKKVRLIFSDNCNLVLPQDTLGASLKDYFYFDTTTYGNVSSIEVNKDTLYLNLSVPSNASNISYLPSLYYNGTTTLYKGPWLRNTRRISALSFYRFPISGVLGFKSSEEVPNTFYFKQNFPNPFNPSTKIEFGLTKKTELEITIYNSLGEIVEKLYKGVLDRGNYDFTWDATNFASGIYYYKFSMDGMSFTKKMVLFK